MSLRLSGLSMRACLLALAAVGAALLFGCRSLRYPLGRPASGAVIHASLTQSGEYFTIKERRRLAVHLPVREGYQWAVAEAPDETVIAPAGRRDEEAAGERFTVFWFTASRPGTTRLRIEERAHEPDAPAGRAFSLTVRVVY